MKIKQGDVVVIQKDPRYGWPGKTGKVSIVRIIEVLDEAVYAKVKFLDDRRKIPDKLYNFWILP